KAKEYLTNGIVKVNNGVFDDFLIGPRILDSEHQYYDMVGSLWLAGADKAAFLSEARNITTDSYERYYFEPLFDKVKFELACKTLFGKRYTFNTKDEYNLLVESFSKSK